MNDPPRGGDDVRLTRHDWLLHGIVFMGILLGPVVLCELPLVASSVGRLRGLLVVSCSVLAVIGLPFCLGARCHTVRLLQSVLLTFMFAPTVNGHLVLAPVWFLWASLLPGEPPSMDVTGVISASFFTLCYAFVSCVHGLWSAPWRCSHASEAA
jgi:hypothetical protein